MPGSLTMRTLIWDVDDVLNALTREWLASAEGKAVNRHGLSFEALTANPPHDLLGTSRQKYLASLDAFRRRAYARLQPDPALLAWLQVHGPRYRHLALSAVPLACAELSAAWVFRHWGHWLRGFHVLPSPRPGVNAPVWDHHKADFLHWLGRSDVTLIDDNPGTCEQAAAAGYAVLRVPQPWNRHASHLRSLHDWMANPD